jgi:hypothetical protein
MTSPKLAVDGFNGRVYKDTLADCPLLEQHGWTGPFEAPSVTTINNAADRKGGLGLWQRRTVAEWAVDNVDTWVELETHGVNADQWERTVKKWAGFAGWTGRGAKSVYARALAEYQAACDAKDRDVCLAWHRKLLIDMVAAAPDRHAREKAQQGTDLHKIIEDVAHGRTPVALMPDDQAHIDQVKEWCDRWQPEFLHAERSVFSRSHGYAGTPDAFVKLPGLGTVVADWKRQPNPYDAVAYQLAPYAHADYLIDGLAPARQALPELVGAVVVNFPPDGTPAQVRPVKPALLAQAWEVFLHTIHLHHDRNTRYFDDPVDAPTPTPGDPDLRAQLEARIAIYRAFFEDTGIMFWLSRHWPDYPTLKKSKDHTAGQLAEIERLLDRAEAEHGLPLPLDLNTAPTTNTSNDHSNKETAA